MSRRFTTLAAAAAAVALVAGLAGCASADGRETGSAGAADDVVKIGVVGKGDPQWAAFEKAAKAEGIDVEIIDFGSYEQPNPALAAGELDLNQFQHIVYLAQYNAANDGDLQPIGATAIYPLGLYSTKHDDVKDIPEGGTVVCPTTRRTRLGRFSCCSRPALSSSRAAARSSATSPTSTPASRRSRSPRSRRP